AWCGAGCGGPCRPPRATVCGSRHRAEGRAVVWDCSWQAPCADHAVEEDVRRDPEQLVIEDVLGVGCTHETFIADAVLKLVVGRGCGSVCTLRNDDGNEGVIEHVRGTAAFGGHL